MSDFAKRQEQRGIKAQQDEQRIYTVQLQRINELVPQVVKYLEDNAETDPRYGNGATAWVTYEDPSDRSRKKEFCWVISQDPGDTYSAVGITTSGVIVEFFHLGSDFARPTSATADFFNKAEQVSGMMEQMLRILGYVLPSPKS